MKYIIFALLLVGCTQSQIKTVGIPYNVSKFKDNDVTCYLYDGHGISCLKDVK